MKPHSSSYTELVERRLMFKLLCVPVFFWFNDLHLSGETYEKEEYEKGAEIVSSCSPVYDSLVNRQKYDSSKKMKVQDYINIPKTSPGESPTQADSS